MKEASDRFAFGEALKRAYPLPEGYRQGLRQAMDALRAKEEPMTHKRALVAVVILVLALGLAGAVALSEWGVLEFLFQGADRSDLESLTQQVAIEEKSGSVQINVDSAYYDGEVFGMDWTIRNTRPETPVFVHVDEFTVGGKTLWTDGTDGFHAQWLPGMFAPEGTMQDGERLSLPIEELQGDQQAVRMVIGIYRLHQPIFRLPDGLPDLDEQQQAEERQQNAELALKKMEEGYQVLWEDAFAVRDPEAEHGVSYQIGNITNILPSDAYTRTEIVITFDLDLKNARETLRHLAVEPVYNFELMTTQYAKAVRTPAGLTLILEAKPLQGKEDAFKTLMSGGRWELTDGDGKPLDIWPDRFDDIGWVFPDETRGRRIDCSITLTPEEMPETVSVSFLYGESRPLVSPIRTR